MTGRRHLLAATLTLGTGLLWAAILLFYPAPWEPGAAAVIASGLLVAAAVAVVLVVVQSSRLGYRLCWGLLAVEAALAILLPFTGLWWAGVVGMMGTGVLLAESTLGGWIRQHPPPTPIPASSLALCLMLLTAGPFTALVSPSMELTWLPLLTVGAWLVLAGYVWRWTGRELIPRVANPILALGGLLVPLPARWVWILALVTATALAWTPGARLAVRPLVERGHPIPIPPELAPADVLHTAGIDDRGRKRVEPQ